MPADNFQNQALAGNFDPAVPGFTTRDSFIRVASSRRDESR